MGIRAFVKADLSVGPSLQHRDWPLISTISLQRQLVHVTKRLGNRSKLVWKKKTNNISLEQIAPIMATT